MSECLSLLITLTEITKRQECSHLHKSINHTTIRSEGQSGYEKTKTKTRTKSGQEGELHTCKKLRNKTSLKGKCSKKEKKSKNIKTGSRKGKLPPQSRKMNFQKLFRLMGSSTKESVTTSENTSPSSLLKLSEDRLHATAKHPSPSGGASEMPKETTVSTKLAPYKKPQERPVLYKLDNKASGKSALNSWNIILIKHKLVFLNLSNSTGIPLQVQSKANILNKIISATGGRLKADDIINITFLSHDPVYNRVVVTFKDWFAANQSLTNKVNLQRAGLLVFRLFENIGDPAPLMGMIKPDCAKSSPVESNNVEILKSTQLVANTAPKQVDKLNKSLSTSAKPTDVIPSEDEQCLSSFFESFQQSQDALIARLSVIRKSILSMAPPPPIEFNFAKYTTQPLSSEDWPLCRFLSSEELGHSASHPIPQATTQQVELVAPALGNGSFFVDNTGKLEVISMDG